MFIRDFCDKLENKYNKIEVSLYENCVYSVKECEKVKPVLDSNKSLIGFVLVFHNNEEEFYSQNLICKIKGMK